MFEFGDWVIFEDRGKKEIGRVTTERDSGTVFVCYGRGCTAAATPRELLRFATPHEIIAADKGIGFHRFDDTCPEFGECCEDFCPEKGSIDV